VLATNIVKSDGFSLASSGKRGLDPKVYAAMTAGLFGLSKRIISSIEGGDLIQTYVKGSKTELIVMSIPGTKLFASVATGKDPNIGLILYELEKTVTKLAEVL
jgi:predicted regulator of Ras-like GTPase activity (Roadblock/LC7/MglB family)